VQLIESREPIALTDVIFTEVLHPVRLMTLGEIIDDADEYIIQGLPASTILQAADAEHPG
jgi:hypothetical protein